MKMMKCKDLGGVYDLEIKANTFEEIAEMSKNYGKEMYMKKDQPHLIAMKRMPELMQNPAEMQKWLESKRKTFENLQDID